MSGREQHSFSCGTPIRSGKDLTTAKHFIHKKKKKNEVYNWAASVATTQILWFCIYEPCPDIF